MATGKAIIYKGIPYFSDVKVPTRVSQLANDAGYLTTHQDISGKADKSATVSTVTWSNNKLTKTINGTTSDVVSAATILNNLTSSQVTSALGYTPASVNTTYDFESPDNSISFNGRAVGSVVTVGMTVEGKVSKDGDTISGDYINTADFIEAGVTGKRVTTYGPWGIDIDEYVGTSLWSKLALRDSDILLTKTWDGTNTSLKTSISGIKQSLSNLGGNGYTAPPSGSYATNVSYGAGGYCRVGKIIIINLRITLSQNISANTALVSNLPVPNASANIVSVMNNRKADIALGTSGQIATADGLNAGNLILSCVYLTS